ncbi:MAG: T9SS type A sorting domain-containing protein [Bacteroidia bacterium]|nr:T9SS type A sorting domain-containing protein [Winogradskyella sp.]MBT8376272.1 T9SS type A sorting domain-containing protein [Bacteroidia bacterium]NNL83170.1 T9SS type A sorting domain-containing protein [Winogradskyella sp.]
MSALPSSHRNSALAHIGNIILQIESPSQAYTTDIYFNTSASAGLDPGYDAAMFNGSAPDFSLYTHLVEENNGVPMAIQALGPNELNSVSIPLGLHAPSGTNVNISISELNLPDNINVYLEDNETNTFTLLNNSNYNFNTNSDLTGTGRFFLRVESGTLTIQQNELKELTIFNDKTTKEIVIAGQLVSSTTLDIFNLNGSIIKSHKLDETSTNNKISVANLPTGIYIITLSTNSGFVKSFKLIIQ